MTGVAPLHPPRGDVAVLLLCKDFGRAKTRLAGRLAPRLRAELAECMLRDVLAAVRRCPRVGHAVLLSDDRHAARIGQRHGVPSLADAATGQLCASIEHAAHVLTADGWPDILVLPSDIPAITPWDISTLISRAPDPGVALVPDRHRVGTNALLGRPLAGMRLHFGPSSLARHCHAARQHGLPVSRLSIAGIALDIDAPADLERLQSLCPGGHTGRFLAGVAADIHADRRLLIGSTNE